MASECDQYKLDVAVCSVTGAMCESNKSGDCTCQHALFFLRWLERTPESFLSRGATNADGAALPSAGPNRRLRWNLQALYEALDARRRKRRLTWAELAREIRCSTNQLTGIRTARYAIGMKLAMRIVQWLERPASTFVTLRSGSERAVHGRKR